MSRVRANKLVNRAGTGAPQLTYGAEIPVGYGLTGAGNINLTGTITAASFSGSITGATGTASTASFATTSFGLSGTPSITVQDATVQGNLTVNGTQTILNTNSLEVEDLNVGIASTATKLTNSQLDGAGITIYGSQGDKTLTWDNANSRMAFSTNVYAPKYYGDGSNLQGVVSGVTLKSSDVVIVGGAATTLNFSGATISNVSSGIATITIASAGLGTEALTASGITTTLNLSKQDHKVTATGITTITVSGGTEGESHTVRIVNSGIATVGFSTYFLFPSGSPPVLPTTSGAISLISFTVHRVGTAGTQLLAGASLNFS
jgi:hypothetical protein